MAKGKSYQKYSANFKKVALTKSAEEGMTDARLAMNLVLATGNKDDGEMSFVYEATMRFWAVNS